METQLEDVYGPLAAHREHNPAEHIRYARQVNQASTAVRFYGCAKPRAKSACATLSRETAAARPSLTWCFLPQSLATWRLTIRI
jgi:hypothetical protein